MSTNPPEPQQDPPSTQPDQGLPAAAPPDQGLPAAAPPDQGLPAAAPSGQDPQGAQPAAPAFPLPPPGPGAGTDPAPPGVGGFAPPPSFGSYPGAATGPAYGAVPAGQSYGPPPPPPSPQAYGQPGAQAYPGPAGYGGYPAAGYPAPTPPPYGAWAPQYPYASWWNRVVATLIDVAYSAPFYLLMIAGIIVAAANAPTRSRFGTVTNPGNGGLVALGVVLALVGLAAFIAIGVYSLLILQGRTGQSLGKRHTGLRVIHEQTGQPLSMGMNFVRQLCHYLDAVVYIGYLWPLWDPKRQTFADKIMTTVVVKER